MFILPVCFLFVVVVILDYFFYTYWLTGRKTPSYLLTFKSSSLCLLSQLRPVSNPSGVNNVRQYFHWSSPAPPPQPPPPVTVRVCVYLALRLCVHSITYYGAVCAR